MSLIVVVAKSLAMNKKMESIFDDLVKSRKRYQAKIIAKNRK